MRRTKLEKRLISESRCNPKLVYSYIKSQRNTKEKIRALINNDGESEVNKRGIANLLSEKFHEAFNNDNREEFLTFESRSELDMKSFFSSHTFSRV